MPGISNLELLNQVLNDIGKLTERGVIPDTTGGFVALMKILRPLLYDERERAEDIRASEEPNKYL